MPSLPYQSFGNALKRYLMGGHQNWLYVGCMISCTLVTGNAIGRLIYGALGQALRSPLGLYSLTLYGFISVTAIASILDWNTSKCIVINRTWKDDLPRTIASSSLFALLGFYQVGAWTGKTPIWAISGAITGMIFGIIIGLSVKQHQRNVFNLGFMSIQIIGIYCAAFINGAIGLMALSVALWWGLIFLILCALYLIGAVNLISRVMQHLANR